jgi:hypothetical protein
MNKKLLIYALVAALAATTAAFAQSVATGGVVQNQGGAASPRTPVKLNLNEAQQLLSNILMEEQLMFIDKATRSEQKSAVILEHCTARMWFMSKEQQDYEKNVVYQMDKNMPSPSRWDQVRKAPSMVSDLLKLTPAQNASIAKVVNAQDERDAQNLSGLSGGDLMLARWDGLMATVPGVMKTLTASQQKEWKIVYEKAHAAMQRAFDTGKP